MTVQPNVEQIKSILRWIMTTFGAAIAGYFAGKGVANSADILAVLTSPANITLLATLIAGIWGLATHTQSNSVAVVDSIAKEAGSPVKGIITESTPAGVQLANSFPGSTTASAGTMSATTMAQR